MNKLLNHIAQVLKWILKIVFSQVPEGFFAHPVAQFGSDIPNIRQVTPRKPPFYSSSTKQFSCNGLSTGSVAEALHEQDTVIESQESRIYINCTRDKKRSPSKEQLMQCKSFTLLRIANAGLQPVKELLRSVQIIKELWRPVSYGDCRTTHKVQ